MRELPRSDDEVPHTDSDVWLHCRNRQPSCPLLVILRELRGGSRGQGPGTLLVTCRGQDGPKGLQGWGGTLRAVSTRSTPNDTVAREERRGRASDRPQRECASAVFPSGQTGTPRPQSGHVSVTAASTQVATPEQELTAGRHHHPRGRTDGRTAAGQPAPKRGRPVCAPPAPPRRVFLGGGVTPTSTPDRDVGEEPANRSHCGRQRGGPSARC